MSRITKESLRDLHISQRKLMLFTEACIALVVDKFPARMWDFYHNTRQFRHELAMDGSAMFDHVEYATVANYNHVANTPNLHVFTSLVCRLYVLTCSRHVVTNSIENCCNCLGYLVDTAGNAPDMSYIAHRADADAAHADILAWILPHHWNVSTPIPTYVREWGRTIYKEEAWEELPMLADALRDVGIGDDNTWGDILLARLASTNHHFRGEAALDFICGYE